MRLLTAGSLVRAQLGEPKREYIRKSVLSFFVLMSGTKQGVCVYGRGIGAKRRDYCITEAFLAFMKANLSHPVNRRSYRTGVIEVDHPKEWSLFFAFLRVGVGFS